MLTVDGVILRGHRQLLERHEDLAVLLADDVAVHDVHAAHRLPRDLVGIFQDLLTENICGLPDGEARDVGLAGGVRAETRGRDVGVLTGLHAHVAVAGEAYRLRHHLGICRICALTDLGLAALEGHRAVEIQQHPVGRGLQRNGINRGVVPEGRKPDAAADVAGIVRVLLLFALEVDVLRALCHALAVGVIVVRVAGERVVKALGHDVLLAELVGVHADGLGAVLNVRFIRKARLRHAVAAHRARRGAVGEHGVGVALHVVAGIVLRERAHRLRHDGVAVGGVGALIGEALHLAGDDGAVLAKPRHDVETNGMAHAVAHERLLAGAVHAYAAPADLRGAPRAQRLIQHVLLIAEAAADVGLDDLNVRPRAAERLTHGAADDVRDLGGGDHHNASVLLIGEAAEVLDVAVLHRGSVVPLVDANQARLLNGGLIVALFHVGVL